MQVRTTRPASLRAFTVGCGVDRPPNRDCPDRFPTPRTARSVVKALNPRIAAASWATPRACPAAAPASAAASPYPPHPKLAELTHLLLQQRQRVLRHGLGN